MSTLTDTASQLAEAEARIERYAVPSNHFEATLLDEALAARRRLREKQALPPVPVDWHVDASGTEPYDRLEYVAHTIGYDLYVFPAVEDGDPHTWIVDAVDGRPVAAGDETCLAGAFAEAVRAYSDRVPNSYALRSFSLAGYFTGHRFPFGPALDGIPHDMAIRIAVDHTEANRGSLVEIIDPQGRLLVTVQDGVPATP